MPEILPAVRWFAASLLLFAVASGCSQKQSGPTPTVGALDPSIVCVEQLVSEVVLWGDGLSPLPIKTLKKTPRLVLPEIALIPEADLAGAPLTGDAVLVPDAEAEGHVRWVSEREMRFDVFPELGLQQGVYGLRVTNGNGNSVTAATQLVAVDAPSVEAVVPDLICTVDGARSVTVEGSGFLILGTTLPEIRVGDMILTPTGQSGCVDLPGPVDAGRLCTQLTVAVPEAAAVTGYAIEVVNPAPAACASSEAVGLFVVAAPVLDGVDPEEICNAGGDQSFQVAGAGFLNIGGALPALVLSNSSGDLVRLEPASASAMSGCSSMQGPAEVVGVCTGFQVVLPSGSLADVHALLDGRVDNPMPAGCSSNALPVTNFPAPTITSVAQETVCQGAARFDLTGAAFFDGMQLDLTDAGGTAHADVVAVTGSTAASAAFQWVPAGLYELTVTNPGGCSTTHATQIAVELGPVAFFADPVTVYNGIETQLTVYAGGYLPADRPLSAELVPTGGGSSVPLTNVDDSDLDAVRATVPSGTATGVYDVRIDASTGGCAVSVLPAAVTVVDQIDVDLQIVEPGFGWTDTATPVTITADATAGGFDATPRVFLNPVSASSTAVALQAVTFVDSETLTAVIPSGLPTDTYDLIVVNPDGTVAVSDTVVEQFRVTADPPPSIDTLTPGSLPNGAQTITVTGADFRSPEVSFDCHLDDGGTQSLTGTVDASTATTIDVSVDFGTMVDAHCVVRATDMDNSTYADFSSLKVTNLAQKLFSFSAGPNLNLPRRRLVAAAGRVSSAARYLYAIGGDDGTDAGTYDSVEASAVDIYGVPRPFGLLRNTMSTPRGLAGGVTIGRFVYVVGGTSDGADALASVERAYILSPATRPVLEQMSLAVTTSDGPGAGIWYYKVAAVMDTADPHNPGGETLPSEAMVVRLPDLVGYAVEVSLSWVGVPGAVGYRVYRSPVAGAAAGSEQLLAELGNVTTYTDRGGAAAGVRPLQVGALGVWHSPVDGGGVPIALSTARVGAGVAYALNPDGPYVHIYVVGGRCGFAELDTYEMATLSLESGGSQTLVQNFTPGANTIPNARWGLGAYWANPENASNVGSTHYIYAGGGANSFGVVNDVDAAPIVWPSGELGAWDPLTSGSDMVNQAGYGAIVANNFLYAFGGKANIASDIASQALICAAGTTGCGGSVAPVLKNWTNTEEKMLVPRQFMGTAMESAFIYLLGGATLTEAATTTTEMTVW